MIHSYILLLELEAGLHLHRFEGEGSFSSEKDRKALRGKNEEMKRSNLRGQWGGPD